MAKSIEDRRQKTEDRRQNSSFSGSSIYFLRCLSSVLCFLAMLIFACHASTHMVAAGDTWVALACGRHFVKHGVDTVEPFSANSHKPGPTPEEVKTWPEWAQWITNKVGLETVKKWHPTGWINQNWLTHVIFYWLSTTFGSEENPHFNALVYWKFAIYILTVICVYYTGRLLAANTALSAVLACFAMFIGRSFFDIRPAGFSNLLVAIFLFILVLTTYRNILYIWLIVPLTVFWCNVHGGYIYVFIMLMPFVFFNLLTCFSKKRFVSIGLKGVYHTIAAGFVAFVSMVLFNPFHLTNLTHTFVISVSEHAARWRDIHEWHPAFDWDNPVGTAIPFLVMFIIAWLTLLIWAIVLIATSRSISRYPKRKVKISADYQWPKIDLALMVIAALTIYMAIRSRRFIPIAAFAACPIIAMCIDQIARTISATRKFHKESRLTVSPMPYNLQLVFTLAGAAAVVFFGTWWGLKFKYIYLDPWPSETNPKLCTVFMRMTASDAKPFDVGRFIKDNKLKGKMFNYWTEGGFIAWAQEPDPNTGKIPLQLFMDGRAQAAYNREVFDLWSIIMSGGRLTIQKVASATARRQNISADDYAEIGRWMDSTLKQHNVWVFLMPAAVYNDPEQKHPYHSIKGLEYNRNWPLVFFNNEQKLFIDYNSPQGRELFDGIRTGKTLYPDDFHRSLILARNTLLFFVNQLEHQTRQIEIAKNTLKAELNNEDLAINAKEKTVAQLREKLANLSEQLKTVQEQLEVAEKKEGFELEELEKQKEQIEKEKKAVQAKLDTENAIIKAQEKVTAESRDKLAQLSEQLKTVQERLRDAKKQGLDFAIRAFNLNPSAAPMMDIIFLAGRFTELRPQIDEFCKNYFDNFAKNKDAYAKQDGYRLKVQAAHLAGIHLEKVAREQRDTKLANFYDSKTNEYASERDKMFKRW